MGEAPEQDLAALRRQVEELQSENARLREEQVRRQEDGRALSLLVDSLPGVVYRYRTIPRWELDFVGKNCQELTGYAPEYFIKDRHPIVSLIKLEDQAHTVQNAVDGISNRRMFSSEFRIVTADGAEKWVMEKGQGVWDGDTLLGTEGFLLDITEQKRARDYVAESEALYRSLVELCPDGIAIHDGQHLLYGNAVALNLFGVERLEDARLIAVQDIIHPDYRELSNSRIALMMAGESTPHVEQVFVRHDGSLMDVEVAARAITYHGQPAVLVVFRDITARKRTRQQLQEALARFESVIEHTPLVAIQGVDREGNIRHWNQTSTALFGMEPADVSGKKLQDILVTPESSHTILNAVQRAWDTCEPMAPVEWHVTTPAEIKRYVYTSIFPVVSDGVTEEAFAMEIDITSRRLMEEELRQTQELLRSVVVNLPLAVFLKDAQEFRFLLWNKCNEEMLGLTEAEVLFKTDFDLFPREQAEFFRNMDLQTLKDGKLTDTPVESITTKRGVRLLHTRKIPIYNSKGEPTFLLGISVDVTEQKQAEQALRDSEAKYHDLFQFFPDPVFLETLDGKVLDCNTLACEFFGYDKKEMLTLTVSSLVPPEIAGRLADFSMDLSAGILVEALGKKRNGEIFPSEVQAKTVRVGGAEHVLVHVRDITERKRAQEEQARLESQILQAQKLESLGVLAGGIAHDFNNLLTAILGYADLTESELPQFSPLRDNLHQIVLTARRGAELTKQMLAYSGRGKFSIQHICISDIVEEMAHLLRVSISKKAIIQYRFAEHLPKIEADATQIRQVVMNLIINASEAIGEENGIITISTGTIRCDRDYLAETYLDENLPAGQYVYLEVNDTGCGMEPETRQKLFDPFFTTKFTGRGLGLAAVLGIVRGHRGAIRVYSEKDKGSTFKVLFPICPDAQSVEKTPAPPSRVSWQGAGTILVVDDEEVVRLLAQKMLTQAGFNVLLAQDGQEAVEMFRAQAHDIDLVLLDMTMPRMGGEEAFSAMRRYRGDARVILSSGYAEQDATAGFAGKGLAGFVQKPYIAEELLALVRQVMEK